MISLPVRIGLLALACVPASAWAHSSSAESRAARVIEFPDIPGFKTLKCDFHQHTVFSDGRVWPTVRVQEAMRDGLDAMAITDHLEYQPHREDIPHPDRNRGFAIASKVAADMGNLLVVKGAEVTRDMPPGHANAIFLQDANALLRDDVVETFREAARQGAFVFWNHPSWLRQTPDGVARLTPLHEQLFNEGLIQGIEVVNLYSYSDEALQIALDRNLTIMANSDVHGLIDWEHDITDGGHRPVTLVFAKEKTIAGLHEALRERRTVVWYRNSLIGREEWIRPLLASSLRVRGNYRPDTTVIDLEITNPSDAEFVLLNASSTRLHDRAGAVTVKPHETTKVAVKTIQRLARVVVAFQVLNVITAPGVHPVIELAVDIPEPKSD